LTRGWSDLLHAATAAALVLLMIELGRPRTGAAFDRLLATLIGVIVVLATDAALSRVNR